MDSAKKKRAASEESKATAEGDLEVTSKALKADIAELSELHRDCMNKAEEFELETRSRGEELKALATAKKIILEATGGAFEQVSFFQRSQITSQTDLARYEAVRFVRDLAHKHHSPSLAQLATRIAAAIHSSSGDPFEKIKGLIGDMIEKLQREAEEDATEKAYCDKELGETEAKKDDKETQISKLSTQMDKMTAKSGQLTEDIAALQKSLSDLAKSQGEMDKLRDEEHKLFEKTNAELEKGVAGVKLALKVLRDYYNKADKAHGASDAGAGIIGLLEVCESDFTKELAEINSAEETAQSAYDKQTKENEIAKVTNEQDVKFKSKEVASLETSLSEAASDKDAVQEELSAVMDYLSKVKERCVAKAESYSDKVAAREQEIAGLKEALEILSNEASLIQTKNSRLRVHQSKLDSD
jgi:chromosome segregation ATPase